MILNLVRQTKYLDTRIYKLIAGLTPSSLAIQAKYHPFVGYLTRSSLDIKKNRISLPFSLQYNHLSTKSFILRLFWPFSPIFHPHTTGNSLNFNFNNFTLMKIWNLDLSHHDHIKTELLTLLSKHHPKIADRLLKGCSNTITNLNIKE